MPTVSTDDKFVDRYVLTDEEEGEAGEEAPQQPVIGRGPTEAALGEPEKKKKKKKRSKKKKMPAEVSGFEEFYAEAPLTVDQAKEASQIYAPDRSFNERIETCIQRYRAKRKLDQFRQSMFDQYLNLGGIRAGQKQFGGGLLLDDENHEEELDAFDIALQTATDYVDTEMAEGEWYVDFELVAKAFMSHHVPFVIGLYKPDQLKTCCKLIENFLNYVLFHNAATEYTENIQAAVKITRKAEEELSLISMFGDRIPGKFNKACVLIFGGSMIQIETPGNDEIASARKLIEKSIVSMGTVKQSEVGVNAKHVKEENIGLTVVRIEMPPRGSYKDVLGKMVVKPWVPEGERMPKTDLGTFEIWLEKQSLQYAFVGMKFECHVHTLSSGVFYFENITAIQCSFYTYLELPHHKGEGDGEVYTDVEGNVDGDTPTQKESEPASCGDEKKAEQ